MRKDSVLHLSFEFRPLRLAVPATGAKSCRRSHRTAFAPWRSAAARSRRRIAPDRNLDLAILGSFELEPLRLLPLPQPAGSPFS